MTDEQTIELYRTHHETARRFAYFLLAAAGAAIAFATTQTRDETLAWIQIPLAIAIVFWGVSFYLGCLHVKYTIGIIRANAEMLNLRSGRSRLAEQNDFARQYPVDAANIMQDLIEKDMDRSSHYAFWQFRLLVAGAALYVIWHALEMWSRTAGA